jgi:uncharacterized protein (TIGR02246 family)
VSEARAAFEDLAASFQTSWNAHDAAALSRAFHAEARFVNRFGRLAHGRAAIAEMHAPIFASIYRDSVMTCWVEEVETLSEGAAFGFMRCDLKLGDAMPHGPRDVPGRMLAIAARGQDGWLFKAAENVAMVDPMTGEPNPNL